MSNKFSRLVDRLDRKRKNAREAIARACVIESIEDRILLAAVAVNATSNVHAINPLIYGASFAAPADITTLNLTSDRDGGNASDTYNYQEDASNHGSDWYYESLGNGGTNGADINSFVSGAEGAGAAPLLTMDIMPYVAALGSGSSTLGSYPVSVYGAQQGTDPYNSNWGNGVTTGGTNILDTNPTYDYIANSPAFEQGWVQELINTFGTPGNGGVPYFVMGNEPSLWSDTHRDLHPNPETNTELINDIISYASMIKSIDPTAQIVGPEEWGWLNYFVDAAGNKGPGGIPVEAALLEAMQTYQTQNGVRLLDYFSNHIYPQATNVFTSATDQATELLRNETTRDLWDPSYVDPSWIGQNDIDGGIIDLIPTMQNWVNQYYPGTKTAITEYNWGADGDMNGATAQADLYGIFGAQGLDMADRWGVPAEGTPTYLAMQLWRNYDGKDSGFGNISVGASVANPDDTDAFAAIRSSDGALTVAVINKNLYSSSNPTGTTPVTISLSNFNSNGVAQEWQLAAINPANQTAAAITHLANINFTGNSIVVNVPMESVSMFVIEPVKATPAAPTGLNAAAGYAQAMLNWNASSGATSYNIYRSSTTSGAETLFQSGVTTTSYTNTLLTNGAEYYYQVSAVGSGGEGSLSSQVTAIPTSPLPAGWSDTDINSPTKAGAASDTSGAWTVLGGGADIASGTSDQFNFAHESITGNGQIVAEVNSAQDTNANAEAGVMFRNGTAANAQYADVVVSPVNGVSFSYRTTAGGTAVSTGITGIAAPEWVKLVYSGANFTGYYSANGSTWTQIGSTVMINMPSALLTGLAVTAYNNTQLNTATFSNVAISGQVAAPPAPMGLTPTAGNGQVLLNWNPSSGATTYNIYRATTSGGEGSTAYKTGITLTNFTDTPLTNGTTYYYQVTAVNSGESPKSSEVMATPLGAPVAGNDAYGANEDATLTIAPNGVLANDTDPNSAALTASVVSTPAHGTLTFDATGDGGFKYVPNTGFAGTDTFTYKDTDTDSQTSNTATVTLTVSAVAPTVVNNNYNVNENSTLTIAPSGMLSNDTAPAGESLTASLVSGPAHGSLTLDANGDGGFKYVPTAGFFGADSFIYKATDTNGLSANATVTLTVNAVGSPVANNDSYNTNENTTLTIAPSGVLGNDTDPNNLALTASLISTTTHGTLTFDANGDGGFKYIPNTGFAGSDTFNYKDTDTNSQLSNTATVTLTVNAIAPTVANDSYNTSENSTLTIAPSGILSNDSAPAGESLTASLLSGPANGSLTLDANGDGGFQYVPNTGFSGADSFVYKATDSNGLSANATVSLSVSATTGLPSPWVSASIGSQGVAGSASYSNGTFSVSGSGTDIIGTADALEGVFQTLSGDGTIIAQVLSVPSTGAYAKAGIMIRSSTAANSQEADMVLTPSGAFFESRAVTGGTTAYTETSASVPYWLKLVRSGNSFFGYISSNGTTWTLVSSATIAMSASVQIGLVSCSTNNTKLGTSTFANVSVAANTTTLPSPWQATSIGSVGVAGSAGYNSGTFTVSGSGADIIGTTDALEGVFQTLSGDGTIIAQVLSVPSTGAYAKAGIMIRASTAANSQEASMILTPSGAFFESRGTTGGTTAYAEASAPVPYWLKLVRSGNAFFGYISSNGTSWTLVSSATIAMGASVQIGLVSCSTNNSQAGSSTFANVSVTTTTSTLPSPWQATSIGSVGVAGSASYSNGTFSVSGSGTDIIGTADALEGVFQTLSGDGTIIAQVLSVPSTGAYAKAGIMIRSSTAANSQEADMVLTPSGAFFESRAATGGTTAYTEASAPVPYWLKLVRSGNTFSGYVSSDGVTWTLVSSATIAMGTSVQIGLVSCSTNNNQSGTSTFANVSVT